jgi:tetratricopeptide (TPR) repeat protein
VHLGLARLRPQAGRNLPTRLEVLAKSVASQTFELHTLLSERDGFDPYNSLQQGQRNLFEMLFPVPEKHVARGDEWPMKVQLSLTGPGLSDESSVARLKRVRNQNGSKVALINFRSKSAVRERDKGLGASMKITGAATFDITKGHFDSNELAVTAKTVMGSRSKMTMKTTVSVALTRAGMMEPDELERLAKVTHVREAIGLAIKLAKQNKIEEALQTIEKVLDAGIPGEHAHLIAAQLHTRLEQWSEAEEAIETELQHFPESLQALSLATHIYRQLDKPEKAKAAQEKLKEIMTRGQEE